MNRAILCEGTREPLHRQLRGTLYHEITQILQEDNRMRRFLLEFLHFHTYFLHAWTNQSAHLLHDFIKNLEIVNYLPAIYWSYIHIPQLFKQYL